MARAGECTFHDRLLAYSVITAEVIDTKRSPSIWSVKAGHRYKASFTGPDARANAERYADDNFGRFYGQEKAKARYMLARPILNLTAISLGDAPASLSQTI